jgi:nitronate monooxygenase
MRTSFSGLGTGCVGAMKRVDDFRLRLGKHELVPIMIGGMGVDISTAELALEAARLGGIGHISDAMVNTVADRRFNPSSSRTSSSSTSSTSPTKTSRSVKFDLGQLAEATRLHVGSTMEAQARRRPGLHQLHGKADHERAEGNLRVRMQGGARRRHRRHHAGGRPASGLVRR